MWKNICRLCSSRGDYDIFALIPSYLHASPNEFLHWQKPINKLLEETTGLSVDTNDGLPQKMCALCISYLKHAATFRQQAINNAISLKAVSAISCKNDNQALNPDDPLDEKASVLFTANDLVFSEERKTEAYVNILNRQSSRTKSEVYMKKKLLVTDGAGKSFNENVVEENEDTLSMTYLNLLFEKGNSFARTYRRFNHSQKQRRLPENNKLAAIFDDINNVESDPLGEDFQTASSDENEDIEPKNIFSYKEKNFEEDDIMDLDELKAANIRVNIPETCKERKCRACFRRFMFEESYKEHRNSCIEYKFLLFIEEINRLLDIRRSKAVSPHEFIRRMIFCLRKTCEWLKTSCGEIILPDLLLNGEAKKRLESDGKNSTAEISSGGNSDETTEKNGQDIKPKTGVKPSLFDILKQDTDPSLVSSINLPINNNQRGQRIGPANSLEKIEDGNARTQAKFENILSLIDKRLNDENQTNDAIFPQQDLDEHNLLKDFSEYGCEKNVQQPSSFIENFRLASFPKLSEICSKNAFSQSSFPLFYNNKSITARCSICKTVFDSVGSLETHNANFHNNHKPEQYDEYKNIISLFEDDKPAMEETAKRRLN